MAAEPASAWEVYGGASASIPAFGDQAILPGAVAAQFGVWSRSGSSIIRGNLLVLPIGDDGLLYVEPIFLQAEGAPFPEFVRVIMVSEDRIRYAYEQANGDPSAVFHELSLALGEAWDEELEPFRQAADGAPVRWLHQVV